jgi:hypothetical protein
MNLETQIALASLSPGTVIKYYCQDCEEEHSFVVIDNTEQGYVFAAVDENPFTDTDFKDLLYIGYHVYDMVSRQMRNTFLNVSIEWAEESVSVFPPSEEFAVNPELQEEARFLFEIAETDLNNNFTEGLVVFAIEEISDFLESCDMSPSRVLH